MFVPYWDDSLRGVKTIKYSCLLFGQLLCCLALSQMSNSKTDGKAENKTDAYDVPEVVVVENRLYQPSSDLGFHLGILPIDAFYRAFSFGMSYSRVIGSAWSWEIINLQGAAKQDTNLKSDLIEKFSVQPTGILDYVKGYGTTSLISSPVYGKNLFFNRKIIHSEISYLMGGGMVSFNSGESAPLVATGVQLRFFRSQTFSIKFDTRLLYHVASNKSSNFILDVGLTFSLDTPSVKSDGKSL